VYTRFTRLPLALIPLALLLAGCASSAATIAPTARPPRPGEFSAYAKNPVIPHGVQTAWAARYVDPGAMVYHDGAFHMFFNGINAYPGVVSLGYATSPDGYTWSLASADPVFTSDKVKYAPIAIFASSVLVGDDGTWTLYFYTVDAGIHPRSTIGRATAPKPTGPWTPAAEPVLTPGVAGAWDAYSVAHPSVLRTSAGYVMYYSAAATDSDPHDAIGMATSPDGIHWTKRSEPVLRAGTGDAWDNQIIFDPNVVQTPNGYVMAYLALGPNGVVPQPFTAVGYATSADGVAWAKSSESPVLSTLDHENWQFMFLANLLYQNGTLFLYFDLQQQSKTIGVTDVFMATHTGLLSS
jgi:predicted GH43/DUF377 family glycosyl hydrolase